MVINIDSVIRERGASCSHLLITVTVDEITFQIHTSAAELADLIEDREAQKKFILGVVALRRRNNVSLTGAVA